MNVSSHDKGQFSCFFCAYIYIYFFWILDILYKIKAIAKISNICLKKRAYSRQNVRIKGWINLICSWARYGLCWGFIWFSAPLASNIWGIRPFSLEESRVSTSVSFWRFFFFLYVIVMLLAFLTVEYISLIYNPCGRRVTKEMSLLCHSTPGFLNQGISLSFATLPSSFGRQLPYFI